MDDDCDILPVRFGSRVEDEAAVRRVLDERHEALTGALERVHGAVELSVRVVGEDELEHDPGPAPGGAAYIRAKASRGATADSIHGELSALARAAVIHGSDARDELLRAAYLVDRAGVEAFTARVASVQQERPQLRLLCTGPWPPYSFTSR
jgi:Gas vesicle synthesis protein GvpL/GvpF